MGRFRTVTPVWIHWWIWHDTQSLMLYRGRALLFVRVIHQISRSHGRKVQDLNPIGVRLLGNCTIKFKFVSRIHGINASFYNWHLVLPSNCVCVSQSQTLLNISNRPIEILKGNCQDDKYFFSIYTYNHGVHFWQIPDKCIPQNIWNIFEKIRNMFNIPRKSTANELQR